MSALYWYMGVGASCLFCRSSYQTTEFIHSVGCNYPKLPGKPLLTTNEIQWIWSRAEDYSSLTRACMGYDSIRLARVIVLYEFHTIVDRLVEGL